MNTYKIMRRGEDAIEVKADYFSVNGEAVLSFYVKQAETMQSVQVAAFSLWDYVFRIDE